MRLAVAIAAHNMVPAGFANDLADLYAYTRINLPDVETTLTMVTGSMIHHARELLAESLIFQWGATHVFWLDSDMRFPKDTALRLLAHDVALVGCNCRMRNPPHYFTARRNGAIVETNEQSRGIEKVDTNGIAVCLMQAGVILNMKRPRFWFDYENGKHVGEDWHFFRKARELGFELWIDHDLSKEIGHIGQHEFRYNNA